MRHIGALVLGGAFMACGYCVVSGIIDENMSQTIVGMLCTFVNYMNLASVLGMKND